MLSKLVFLLAGASFAAAQSAADTWTQADGCNYVFDGITKDANKCMRDPKNMDPSLFTSQAAADAAFTKTAKCLCISLRTWTRYYAADIATCQKLGLPRPVPDFEIRQRNKVIALCHAENYLEFAHMYDLAYEEPGGKKWLPTHAATTAVAKAALVAPAPSALPPPLSPSALATTCEEMNRQVAQQTYECETGPENINTVYASQATADAAFKTTATCICSRILKWQNAWGQPKILACDKVGRQPLTKTEIARRDQMLASCQAKNYLAAAATYGLTLKKIQAQFWTPTVVPPAKKAALVASAAPTASSPSGTVDCDQTFQKLDLVFQGCAEKTFDPKVTVTSQEVADKMFERVAMCDCLGALPYQKAVSQCPYGKGKSNIGAVRTGLFLESCNAGDVLDAARMLGLTFLDAANKPFSPSWAHQPASPVAAKAVAASFDDVAKAESPWDFPPSALPSSFPSSVLPAAVVPKSAASSLPSAVSGVIGLAGLVAALAFV
ncbi:hypothetical protein HDU88_008883 [Geranomyces variabilis]|nr:hypothetical protein HDU88_008883 [Geranomyces variabilis]